MNAGIPYADSFYVELSYCLSNAGSEYNTVGGGNGQSKTNIEHGSQLVVFASIKYKKTVWGLVKSK